MVSSNAKGSRRERELVGYFREGDHGTAIRIPASGSATDMDLPDVLVGFRITAVEDLWAAELKTGNPDSNIYLQEDEADALARFASAFGAKPLVGVRWDHDTTWYLEDVYALPTTDGGSVRLDPDKRDSFSRTVERPDGY